MDNVFLKDLNKEQQNAVLATEGPVIILAGAGSGKTRVLTHRVMYLMAEKHIHPENILMVTFTNKAANEMKERIQHFFKEQEQEKLFRPLIATFHSLCAKILRIDGKHIGLSERFIIYDDSDQIEAIKESMRRINISTKDFKPSSILTTISQAKNELLSPLDYLKYARGYFQETVSKIYPMYQQILKENDAVDFDDLINKTIYMFDQSPSVLHKYQEKFQYVLVDEYQDTNKAQYTLTRLLSAKWKNVCVVGDFSQSIYSWRGADFQNLIRFEKDFSGTKTFSLSQNYRSTQKILDAASTIIAHNTGHPVLKLWTKNPIGEEIEIYEANNEQDESEFILKTIFSQGIENLKDVAVLYRTNAQSRVVEEVFLHHAIPYMLVGGTRFYDRKEIKDVISYLRLLSNPKDMISYKRLEKIGKNRLSQFLAFQENLDAANSITIDLMDGVINATHYLELYDGQDEQDRMRLENIKELRSVAIAFPNLSEFLENIMLVEQEYRSDKKDGKNGITLMTLHAAKGLEFPIIFMIGMEEGLFPHSRALMDKQELEEERRLCYVGMTRAQHKLYLSYAKRRLFFGQRTSNTVSRFVQELPEEVVSKQLKTQRSKDDSSSTDFF